MNGARSRNLTEDFSEGEGEWCIGSLMVVELGGEG
jgi:hypothetical protein